MNSNSQQDRLALTLIGVVSVSVLAFLFWLIYFKEGTTSTLAFTQHLPALNALLNSLTTVLLIAGYIFIKKGYRQAHIKTMITAVATSGLFLISYVIYHHFQGDTKFTGIGLIRYVYFFILITHIVLSVAVVPMVFTTLYYAAKKNYSKHKKIARVTFPVWLYVSVTGVLIFFLLKGNSL